MPDRNQLSDTRLQHLFEAALDVPYGAKRDSFLDSVCGSDSERRRKIEALLANHRDDGFLEQAAVERQEVGTAIEATESKHHSPEPAAGEGQEEGIASDASPASKVFGDYDLMDEIARGGMGIVYRARQRSLGRTVALKLIAGGQLATRDFVRRFRSEAAAAAALQHPNIVAIHDVGVHDGNHFFSMDYVEGQNLAELVGNQPLAPKKSARYLKSISDAVQHAHDQGILHRDLKPSNVLVDAATDQPHVTDFGLARRLDSESSLTITGQVLGSPHFMPPEQADPKRGRVGRVSDVYGLGAILYFLLTTRPPFPGDTIESTLHQVLNAEPVSPRLLNPAIPRDLQTICLKCLSKEQSRRYPTAQALGEDLGRFIKGEPILARPTTRLEKTWRWCLRNRAVAGLLATAAILILTLAIGSPIAALRIRHSLQVAEANLYGADLNMVQTALADANLVHARRLLDRHRPEPGQRDQRGFEWRYLWRLCQGDEEYVFEPAIPEPRRVVFSNDGRMLAAGESSGNLSVVWNLTTKAVVKTLPQGDRPVAFAPTTPLLITAGGNGLKRWNTQTWEEEWLGPCGGGAAAAFSPEGRTLVVYGNGLQVWETEGWTPVNSNAFGAITLQTTGTLSVSRDGTMVCRAHGFPYDTESHFEVLSLPSLEPKPWSNRFPEDISAAVFHPELDLLATGGWSGDIRLWDTKSGLEIPSFMKQTQRIMAMSFSPTDTNLLATTGGDRSIRLWDLASQKERTRLHGAVEQILELAFSPDGQTIATGGHGNPITLWNATQTKAEIITVPTGARNILLGYSNDGARLRTLDARGRVMDRDATSLAVSATVVQLDLKAVYGSGTLGAAIAVTRDMSTLALGLTNGVVEIWDLAAGTKTLLKAHSAPVRGLAFSPDGRELATAGKPERGNNSSDGEVRLWNLATLSRIDSDSARLDQVSNLPFIVCVRFSPKGEWVAVGSGSQLSIFSGKDLRPLEPRHPELFKDLDASLSLRFSPDGHYIASGRNDGRLWVWDTRTWSRRSLPGHERPLTDLTFSPDGRRMVSGAEKLIVWDTDTWQPLASYKLSIQDTDFIHFSPDGNDLITSDPYNLRLWRAASSEDIADREARLGRWH